MNRPNPFADDDVLCDTNILSELARPRPEPERRVGAQGVLSIAVSVITVEEITYGRHGTEPQVLDGRDLLRGY